MERGNHPRRRESIFRRGIRRQRVSLFPFVPISGPSKARAESSGGRRFAGFRSHLDARNCQRILQPLILWNGRFFSKWLISCIFTNLAQILHVIWCGMGASDMKYPVKTSAIAGASTVVALLAAPKSAEAAPFFIGLGDLAGGPFYSVAFGVSADGAVVVGQGQSASGFEAFVWDAVNGMRNLEGVLTTDFVSSQATRRKQILDDDAVGVQGYERRRDGAGAVNAEERQSNRTNRTRDSSPRRSVRRPRRGEPSDNEQSYGRDGIKNRVDHPPDRLVEIHPRSGCRRCLLDKFRISHDQHSQERYSQERTHPDDGKHSVFIIYYVLSTIRRNTKIWLVFFTLFEPGLGSTEPSGPTTASPL